MTSPLTIWTIIKVYPPPTTQLETNTQADKIPVISPRIGVQIFHSRGSPKVLTNHITHKIKLRDCFAILNIWYKIDFLQHHLALKNEPIMYLGEHNIRTRHLKYYMWNKTLAASSVECNQQLFRWEWPPVTEHNPSRILLPWNQTNTWEDKMPAICQQSYNT